MTYRSENFDLGGSVEVEGGGRNLGREKTALLLDFLSWKDISIHCSRAEIAALLHSEI
jgi:hypothetical protein